MEDNSPKKQLPDRPLECCECKKEVGVRYTEITREGIIESCYCKDCPELQKKLYGTTSGYNQTNYQNGFTHLVCGTCGTTFEELKKGHDLGCPECYAVFEEFIVLDMQTQNRYPSRPMASKKGSLIHIGRSPSDRPAMTPSSKLMALNEALKEMINKEDYEQAAFLRDQIKELTERDPKK